MSALVSSVQVIQAALKGLQCCLSGGKWKFGEGEELGSILASLKVQNCNIFADFSLASLFYLSFILQKVYIVHSFCRGSCFRELQV